MLRSLGQQDPITGFERAVVFVAPPVTGPTLIEGVVNAVLAKIKADLPAELDAVQVQFPAGHNDPVLEKPKSFFISEQFIGLRAPAIYVLAAESEHKLDESQQWAFSHNRLQVVVVVEEAGDLAEDRLTRYAWRYALALWRTLHDKDLGGAYPLTRLLVERIQYTPIVIPEGASRRVFRKEAWLDVQAPSMEVFE